MQILPSGQAVADRRGAGLALAPFRGVRYAQDRVSGLAEVTSPPYDVIAQDKESQLLAADPHNIVRVILPRDAAGTPGGQYREAARALADWQRDGILARDRKPALYVYEQAARGNGRPGDGAPGDGAERILQRGLIGALTLVPPEAGVVLPHEDTAPGPVADRRQLMEVTGANLEPIFLLYDGSADHGAAWHRGAGDSACGQGGSAATRIADAAAGRAPLVDIATSDGLRHRMWAITDRGELAAIAADLAPRQALIADGHHRYAAYRQIQQHRDAGGVSPGPWDRGLALLVDSAAYPPQIAAIHRVIPGLPAAAAAEQAAASFRVRQLPGGIAGLPAALAELAGADRLGPAFLVAGDGAVFLLTDPDPDRAARAMPAGRSERWQGLAPAVLQELLMRATWGVADTGERVRIVHDDAAAAVRAAQEAPGSTAVISCPVPASDIYAVAALGERVPRKSTSFSPKPRTGLVIRTFAES